MRTIPSRKSSAKGSSLIEVMIAMGVLAVAVPLVLGTMVQTGGSNLSAQAETRSSWIVQSCFEELQYAMRGESQYIEPLKPGEDFGNNSPLALGFGIEGSVLGKVSGGSYDRGVTNLSNKPVRYIAVMSGEKEKNEAGEETKGLKVKITLEYPAGAPAAKRQKIDFHTRIP